MNQEQPFGSDQQGLVSARRRSAARWELKSRVALTQTSPRSPSLRIVTPLAITQPYQATLSRPTPAHQCPRAARLRVVPWLVASITVLSFPGVNPFMTLWLLMNFDAFVVFIDSLSYGPLIRRPNHLPYSSPRPDASAGLRFGPFAYSEDNNRWISQRPHFPISSLLDSRCTPQFCYLGKSSALGHEVLLWKYSESSFTNYPECAHHIP